MNAIILSALSGVVMMFSGILLSNKAAIKYLAIAALLVLLAGNLSQTYGCFTINVDTKDLLAFSKFGLFFNTIIIVSTLVYFILSGSDIEKVGEDVAEYFALIFFVLCGVTILTSFNGLLMFFIGIEILSIPLYILTGSDKKNLKGNEASLKYFLMGSFSTGILLMGIALLYGATGNFGLAASGAKSAVMGIYSAGILAPVGLVLLFIAMAFKVSAAPFHFWAPDVYDGAPSVFTSFMATIVKAAGFFAFIRLFAAKSEDLGPSWKLLLFVMIVATLFIGNITAVFQQSVKRMLAYSSIAQAGFMLFGLYSSNDFAKEGILLYTAAYSFATIGIFAILVKMKDYSLDGYNGLSKTEPVLAATNAIFFLSLSGIPLTAGFFAKYYMLASAVKSGSPIILVIIAVLFAAISVYYYFKVIQAMYFKEGNSLTIEPIKSSFKFSLIVLAAIIIILGIFPTVLLNWYYF
ncbi:NADH-quinone oxidoreductase subunit N [Parasediminibacterium sp. JCM 36343]|uniref:NADH-quinone oxidoreductase subunit N n=1 Tax=Parasediminibacterium sp. JCM 36343 TaxID=3374279 RepID=UPI00397B934A